MLPRGGGTCADGVFSDEVSMPFVMLPRARILSAVSILSDGAFSATPNCARKAGWLANNRSPPDLGPDLSAGPVNTDEERGNDDVSPLLLLFFQACAAVGGRGRAGGRVSQAEGARGALPAHAPFPLSLPSTRQATKFASTSTRRWVTLPPPPRHNPLYAPLSTCYEEEVVVEEVDEEEEGFELDSEANRSCWTLTSRLNERV